MKCSRACESCMHFHKVFCYCSCNASKEKLHIEKIPIPKFIELLWFEVLLHSMCFICTGKIKFQADKFLLITLFQQFCREHFSVLSVLASLVFCFGWLVFFVVCFFNFFFFLFVCLCIFCFWFFGCIFCFCCLFVCLF